MFSRSIVTSTCLFAAALSIGLLGAVGSPAMCTPTGGGQAAIGIASAGVSLVSTDWTETEESVTSTLGTYSTGGLGYISCTVYSGSGVQLLSGTIITSAVFGYAGSGTPTALRLSGVAGAQAYISFDGQTARGYADITDSEDDNVWGPAYAYNTADFDFNDTGSYSGNPSITPQDGHSSVTVVLSTSSSAYTPR